MSTTTHHRCMSGPGTITLIIDREHEARILAVKRRADRNRLNWIEKVRAA